MKTCLFNLHTHILRENGNEISIVNLFPTDDLENILLGKHRFFSIGLHPWHINAGNCDNLLERIEKFSRSGNIKAIGECGLDRKSATQMDLQKKIFSRHIEIAESAKKPLIIHCVRAYPEIIEIRTQMKAKSPWIVHGFNSNTHTARQLLKHGIFISFGPSLLDSSRLQSIAMELPPGSFFLETDDKNLDIAQIYSKTAECKKMEASELLALQYKNAISIFNLEPICRLN
jgi:TatD DNase family protein